MNTTVSSLQELLDALNGATEPTQLVLTSDIDIDDSIEISTSIAEVNLDGHTITINAESGITLSSGLLQISNGTIIGTAADPFIVVGAGTQLSFCQDLVVSGAVNIAKIIKKGQLCILGADITSTGNIGSAFSVEGYTIASQNSSISVIDGTIICKDQAAISVAKRGQVLINSGTIDAGSNKIVDRLDDSSVAIEIQGGIFSGELPEGAVSPDAQISPLDGSFYEVTFAVDAEVDEPSDTEDLHIDHSVTYEPVDLIVEEPEETAEDLEDSTIDEAVDEPAEVIEEPTEPIRETKDVEAKSKFTAKSDVLYKPVDIFASPCFKFPQGKIIGAYTIIGDDIKDACTGATFRPIQYKLPGNAQAAPR